VKKILLDENLPVQLRGYISKHETSTVAYLGWSGFKNGELLDAAEKAGFDVFITGDLSLEYQQNLSARKLAIISLLAHNWRIIKDHVLRIAEAVDAAMPGEFVRVEFPRPRPSRRPRGPGLG
jgi:putative NIF3 family GTP cyclohydrolase 1 type 2